MNKYLKLLAFGIMGAFAGFAYYYFVGCKNGTCAISSNPVISTLYGAGMGLVAGFPTKKKVDKN